MAGCRGEKSDVKRNIEFSGAWRHAASNFAKTAAISMASEN
jgi:hypothetical protein